MQTILFFTKDYVILLNNTLTCTIHVTVYIFNTPIFIQRCQKYNIMIIPALTSTTNNQNYAPLTTYSVNVYQHTINLVYYFQVIIQSKLGQWLWIIHVYFCGVFTFVFGLGTSCFWDKMYLRACKPVFASQGFHSASPEQRTTKTPWLEYKPCKRIWLRPLFTATDLVKTWRRH